MSSPKLWLDVYDYSFRTAARILPGNPSAAEDIASECFDVFLRHHAVAGLHGDYRKWVGKTLSGLNKRRLKAQAKRLKPEAEEMFFLTLRTQPEQENWTDAQTVRECADRLSGNERWAFEIIADGGTVKDLMEDMHIGPSAALALLRQLQGRIIGYTTPEQRAA